MKTFFYLFMIAFATISLCGCSTLFSKKQTITVYSDVEGAQVYKGSKYVGNTPLVFETKSAKSTFTVKKEGYEPQTINTDVDIRWNTLWNWFNCWTGWFVDIAAGTTQKYTTTQYYVSLLNPEVNENYNAIHKRQYNTIAPENVAGILASGIGAYAETEVAHKQQRNAEKKAKEAARLAQQKELIAKQSEQNIPQSNSVRYNVQNIQNVSSNKGVGVPRDLLTSDNIWNRQVYIWVQEHGVEKTREIVKQYRAKQQYQSTHEANNINKEIVVSAVTSNRKQVNIMIKGGVITAYSFGVDQLGNQKWEPLAPCGSIRDSRYGRGAISEGIDLDLSREFKYTSIIGNNIRIYFNM